VTNPEGLVELFSRDIALHIYALADLEEPYWSNSTWWRRGDAAVGLVGLPGGHTVVYAVSSADPDRTLDLLAEPEVMSAIGPGLVTGVTGVENIFVAAGRELDWHRGYHRYVLADVGQVPEPISDVVPLGLRNVDEALALYATEPKAAFFLRSMMSDETFCGVRSNGRLVAIAGTHVISERSKAAAIGAVYTHPDYRGRGLGRAVTAGVIGRLEGRADVIGLNCTDTNTAAISVYTTLGFTPALAYSECEIAPFQL